VLVIGLWSFIPIGFNTQMLALSFRRKPESTRWMPAYAGMTNTPHLVQRTPLELFIRPSNSFVKIFLGDLFSNLNS
jgi:hypothetical protein